MRWLISSLASRNYFHVIEKRLCKCRCFGFYNQNKDVRKAEEKYMVYWAGLKMNEEKEKLNARIKHSAADLDEQEETMDDIFFCWHALSTILNVG